MKMIQALLLERGKTMSEDIKPDNLEKGTPEYAVVHYAYEVARAIQGVRQAVSSGDTEKIHDRVVWLNYCLSRLRSVTRSITEETKAIERVL
jgi:hypothetical protein